MSSTALVGIIFCASMVLILRGFTLSVAMGTVTIRKLPSALRTDTNIRKWADWRADDFSGGENTVRAQLEALRFSVEVRGSDEPPTVTSHDIELIRQSRSRDRYTDFSDGERAAHKRVHEALRQLAQIAVDELGGPRDYVLKLTSGFHPASGIRGGKPKDLWFGVFRKENEQGFLGNPQIFMIVSDRESNTVFHRFPPGRFLQPGNKKANARNREVCSRAVAHARIAGS